MNCDLYENFSVHIRVVGYVAGMGHIFAVEGFCATGVIRCVVGCIICFLHVLDALRALCRSRTTRPCADKFGGSRDGVLG